MSDSFTFDSISTSTYGAYVYPTESIDEAPARQYTEYTVPGRSGVLLVDNKQFPNLNREYGVAIPSNALQQMQGLVNALASRQGYFRLTDTFDTAHYFKATYKTASKPTVDRRTNMAKINVTFYRKPQRFLLTGETATSYTGGATITNPTMFDAQPLLRVYGAGVVGLAGTNITISAHSQSYIDIDCDTGRSYYGATALDGYVTLDKNDFPTLAPGSNGLTLGSGITQVIVTPRWFDI